MNETRETLEDEWTGSRAIAEKRAVAAKAVDELILAHFLASGDPARYADIRPLLDVALILNRPSVGAAFGGVDFGDVKADPRIDAYFEPVRRKTPTPDALLEELMARVRTTGEAYGAAVVNKTRAEELGQLVHARERMSDGVTAKGEVSRINKRISDLLDWSSKGEAPVDPTYKLDDDGPSGL